MQTTVPEVETFAKELHLVKESYQGETFEGNQINDILKNLQKLKKYVPDHYMDFLETFEALRDLKEACFGYTLSPDYYKKSDCLN